MTVPVDCYYSFREEELFERGDSQLWQMFSVRERPSSTEICNGVWERQRGEKCPVLEDNNNLSAIALWPVAAAFTQLTLWALRYCR